MYNEFYFQGLQSQERNLFLFNDLLLIAKERSTAHYKLKDQVKHKNVLYFAPDCEIVWKNDDEVVKCCIFFLKLWLCYLFYTFLYIFHFQLLTPGYNLELSQSLFYRSLEILFQNQSHTLAVSGVKHEPELWHRMKNGKFLSLSRVLMYFWQMVKTFCGNHGI